MLSVACHLPVPILKVGDILGIFSCDFKIVVRILEFKHLMKCVICKHNASNNTPS